MFIQLVFSGIVIGLFYASVGYGLSIIIKTTKNWHFAHGSVFAVGAYIFYQTFDKLGVPGWAAVVMTVMLTGAFGVALEYGIYKPLRESYPSTDPGETAHSSLPSRGSQR